MNMDDLIAIDKKLASGEASRDMLIEIVNNGLALPVCFKTTAFIFIMQMTPAQIQEYAKYAHEALSFVINKDMDGLTAYLRGLGIPGSMVSILNNYVIDNPENK